MRRVGSSSVFCFWCGRCYRSCGRKGERTGGKMVMAEGRRRTRGLRSKSIALMRQRIQRDRAVVEGTESNKIKSVGGLAVLQYYWIDFEMYLNRQGDCIKYWASRISCLSFAVSFISFCTEQDDTDLQRLRYIWESKVVPVQAAKA